MKIAIIYSSRTGNTEELVNYVYELFLIHFVKVDLYQVEQFPLSRLMDYDLVVIGTYTWGDGEIPQEMIPLYEAFENQEVKHMLTGIVGTGDRFYPQFCGAVNRFRDMLYVQTDLVVTLKVELSLQRSDMERCHKFIELMLKRASRKRVGLELRGK
ncbi:flavodoxin domain-containing protein [Bacillus sp. V3B]|uniref:flavodoxin domain-containing protein n=1 Tax=Bacillus sp. V3B TaxID=2804915 RepID=UPI00210D115E|nr:flavodoxin domain-containing protein [Bacillus sp. V3B]MCQ6274269.1 flavodoxin domain-containing protein [Bacillus sp. V3B]